MEDLAPSTGRKHRSVIDLLKSEPQRFDFFQAVRILELLAKEADSVGDGVHPVREAVRFRASLISAFPASDIDALDLGAEPGERSTMTLNFMGLAGAFGPLPPPINDLILASSRRGDPAPREFLDIFNHRLISLFYRLRRKYRPVLNRGTPADGNFAAYLFALIGLGTSGLRHRTDFPDRALLHYAGLLNQRPRSMHGLELLVGGYFAITVKGRSLVGRWLRIDPTEVTHIGIRGRNHILGGTAVLGEKVWDQQAGIGLDLGPMDLPRYLEFLPVGNAWRPLRSLVRFYVGTDLDCFIRLRLRADAVPPATLGRTSGSRLGWTSWLRTGPRVDEGAVTLRSQ